MKVLEAEHFTAGARAADLPPPGLPEVAFLGRSNVGKSSLINRLLGRRNLARTSSTPGKTRLIHLYRVRTGPGEWLFADLPGYGWAKVSKKERRGWQKLVEGYLENRPTLRAAVLLHDVRRDPTEDETLLLAWLAERGVDALVAVTKADKLKPMRRAQAVKGLRGAFGDSAPELVVTSSQTGLGVDDLWRSLRRRLESAEPG